MNRAPDIQPLLDACVAMSARVRLEVVSMSHRAQTAHLGGALSCVDMLVALYSHVLDITPTTAKAPWRDRLVFSKGHAVSALYAVLAEHGFITPAELARYNEEGSLLTEQPSPGCAAGVEWATGSLGHGLGVGIGMALASRINGKSNRVVVVMSDGECQEGSVWEGAMLAPKLGLPSLTVLIDFNKWQATGRSCEVMAMEPLRAKWESFGWHALEVDGHDHAALHAALHEEHPTDKPLALICHTRKGHGICFMEDDNNWHYRSPTAEEVAKAAKELGLA